MRTHFVELALVWRARNGIERVRVHTDESLPVHAEVHEAHGRLARVEHTAWLHVHRRAFLLECDPYEVAQPVFGHYVGERRQRGLVAHVAARRATAQLRMGARETKGVPDCRGGLHVVHDRAGLVPITPEVYRRVGHRLHCRVSPPE